MFKAFKWLRITKQNENKKMLLSFYNTKDRAIESETWIYKVDDHKVYLVDPDDNYEVGIIIDRYDLFISFIN